MRDDAQDLFTALGARAVRGERRAQPPLVAAEAALGVPALPVERARKAPPQGAPVGRHRPAMAHVARIELDDRAAEAQGLPAEAMVVLGIIGRIRQRGIEPEQGGRLPHGGRKIRRILRGASARNGAKDEVRVRLDDRGELGPRPATMARAFALARAHAIILADVPRFEPGSVDGDDRPRRDQARATGAGDDGVLRPTEGPPFSASAKSRCAA